MFLKASYKHHFNHKMYNISQDDVAFIEQDGDYHNIYVSGMVALFWKDSQIL